MASLKIFVFFTLLSLKLGIITAVVYPAENLQTFDSGNYELRWKYDDSQTEPKMYFKITAKTTGYVALAFPYIDARGNDKLDVVVAGVDAKNGYIKDLHQTVLRTLADDPKPNYVLESFSEKNTKTTQETVVEFSRSKSTGDNNDITFVAGHRVIVRWDYGQPDILRAIPQSLLSNLNSHQSLQQITFVPK